MNARVWAVALFLAACGDDSGDGNTSAEDGSVQQPRDASADARAVDASRDARATVQDASNNNTDDGDADITSEPDAAQEQPDSGAQTLKDAAVDSAVPAPDSGTPPAGTTPVFIAVGYRATRLVSRDLGKTFTETGTLKGGGDDENLLRGVAYANGIWVTTGWKIFTSTDAKTWTERNNPSGSWMAGVAYGKPNGANAAFWATAGGNGEDMYGSDGISWSRGTSIGRHVRSMAFGGGKFMAATDANDWFTTSDGKTWTKDSGGHASSNVVYCVDHFSDRAACSGPLSKGIASAYGMGVWVSYDGKKLQRSTDDGKTWSDVQNIASDVAIEKIAFGMATN